jgi:hypothetical protein
VNTDNGKDHNNFHNFVDYLNLLTLTVRKQVKGGKDHLHVVLDSACHSGPSAGEMHAMDFGIK